MEASTCMGEREGFFSALRQLFLVRFSATCIDRLHVVWWRNGMQKQMRMPRVISPSLHRSQLCRLCPSQRLELILPWDTCSKHGDTQCIGAYRKT